MRPKDLTRNRSRRGNAILEAGLATPVILLLLSGVIDFGRAFYFTDVATSSARAGAQFGMISAANFTNYAGMQNAAIADAAGVPNFTATASSFCTAAGTAVPACQDEPTAAVACTNASAEAYLRVKTQIVYNMILPLDWLGVPNPLKLTGCARMRTQ